MNGRCNIGRKVPLLKGCFPYFSIMDMNTQVTVCYSLNLLANLQHLLFKVKKYIVADQIVLGLSSQTFLLFCS